MDGVPIDVGGRRYRVNCDPAEVQRLKDLARKVDAIASGIVRRHGNVAESMLLLMTSLLLADELEERRNEVGRLESAMATAAAAPSATAAEILRGLADRLEGLTGKIEREAAR
ncbi:MAG: cell division protein ZapA [Geminicoccaceae bacterium]